jgi:hypothetical protein
MLGDAKDMAARVGESGSAHGPPRSEERRYTGSSHVSVALRSALVVDRRSVLQ